MVELREAELLAHHMESCLRAVAAGQRHADRHELRGARRRRPGARAASSPRAGPCTPPPSIDAIARAARRTRGRTATPIGAAGAPGAASPSRMPQSAFRARRFGSVTFIPSPELVARGVKVDTVRARLLQIGQLAERRRPRSLPGGGISFEFDVSRPSDEAAAATCGRATASSTSRCRSTAGGRVGTASDRGGHRGVTERPCYGSSTLTRIRRTSCAWTWPGSTI